MTVQWNLPAYRGNRYCSASALSISSGSFYTDNASPILPPGDYPCVMVAFNIKNLVFSVTNFTAHGGFAFRQWLDLEVAWTIEVANTGSPDVSNNAHWTAVSDTWGLTLPLGMVLRLAGQAASNNFNPYTQQVGPQCAVPFHTAGTYRITAVCRLPNGSGGYVSATKRETVTVTAFAGTTYYYDADSGNNANSGLTTLLPKKDNWNSTFNSGSNIAILFKAGTTAPHEPDVGGGSSVSVNFRGCSNAHFGAWNMASRSDRAKVRASTAQTERPVFRFNLDDTVTTANITVGNIALDANAYSTQPIWGRVSNVLHDSYGITFHNIHVHNPVEPSSLVTWVSDSYPNANQGVKGLHFFGMHIDHGSTLGGQGMFISGPRLVSFVGCYFTGQSATGGLQGHCIYHEHCLDVLGLLCYPASNCDGKEFLFNGNTGTDCDRWFFSLNAADGDAGINEGCDNSGTNNATTDPYVQDSLYEANFARNLNTALVYGYNNGHQAIRNNACVNCMALSLNVDAANTTLDTNVRSPRVHDNVGYTANGNTPLTRIVDGVQSGNSITGNKWQVATTSSPRLVGLNTSYTVTYGYTVDGNQYSVPTSVLASALFEDRVYNGADGTKTWTTWKAAGLDDTTSVLTDAGFGWVDPAQGDFTTRVPQYRTLSARAGNQVYRFNYEV